MLVTPIYDGYMIITPPPAYILCWGNIWIVYAAFYPAPVVFAENDALEIVKGVLVIIVTGLATIFKVDKTFSWLSVMIKLKLSVYFVEIGFIIPLIVTLKVYRALMPTEGFFKVRTAKTEFGVEL